MLDPRRTCCFSHSVAPDAAAVAVAATVAAAAAVAAFLQNGNSCMADP